MKYILSFVLFLMPISLFAETGPTSLGGLSIGMSKAEYISAVGINPVDCNTYKGSDGKPQRSEMKFLDAESKTLCWGLSTHKLGSTENIQVSGISYDVINAYEESSKLIKAFGMSSKAVFFQNTLISLEIEFPNVGIKTMSAKYGRPEIVDGRKTEVCKNKIGNEFNNIVGNLDAVWLNGEVRSILRAKQFSPVNKCTDGGTITYYILENSKQLKVIDDAINQYKAEISKKDVSNSPF